MSEFDWGEIVTAAERCRNKHDGEIPEDFVLFLPDGTSEAICGMAETLFDRDVHTSGVVVPGFGVPTPYSHPFGRTPRTKAGRAMEDFLSAMMGGGVTEEDQERIENIARTGEVRRQWGREWNTNTYTFGVEWDQIEHHSLGSRMRETIRGQSVYFVTFDERYESILAQPKGKKFKLTDITES